MNFFFIGGGNCTHIIIEELKNIIENAYIFDVNENAYKNLKDKYRFIKNGKIDDLKNFKKKNINIDYVIECASIDAVLKYYKNVLLNDFKFIILSTGAFANKIFFKDFFKALKNSKSSVYIPSGAIAGIDLINSIYDKVNKISLITQKPPKNLGFDENLKTTTTIFEGNVYKAIEKFPKNINVAVTLALAVKDFQKVNVKIIADPSVKRNIHTIIIDSIAGNYKFAIENFPSPNGRTSYLAPLSICGIIKKYSNRFYTGV